MQADHRSFERSLRSSLALTSLLAFAAVMVWRLPFGELPQRMANTKRLLAKHETVHVDATPFWFDPHYATFIEAVRQHTPKESTVALIAPETVDLYVYCAAYELAPRRIVGGEEVERARYVAIYGPTRLGLPVGESIPGGRLISR